MNSFKVFTVATAIILLLGKIIISSFPGKPIVPTTSSPSPTVFELVYTVITETPIPTPTPKPTFTPTPTPYRMSYPEMESLFTKYASSQSIDREKLKRIAVCESGLNPSAVNGIYGGLYQFSESTWIVTRRRMNADTNPILRFNPEEAIKTAAFKFATEGIAAWPNCSGR